MSSTMPESQDAQAELEASNSTNSSADINHATDHAAEIEKSQDTSQGTNDQSQTIGSTSLAIQDWFKSQPDLNLPTRVFTLEVPLNAIPWQDHPLHKVQEQFTNRNPQTAGIICTTHIYNPNLPRVASLSSSNAQVNRRAEYIEVLRTNPSYLSRWVLAQKGAAQAWKLMKDNGWWIRVEDGTLLVLSIHHLDASEQALFEEHQSYLGLPDGIDRTPVAMWVTKDETLVVPQGSVFSFAASCDSLMTEGVLFL